jgi:hypothetical protein
MLSTLTSLFNDIRARICKPYKEPGIDSQLGGSVRQPYLTYRPARLHRLAESIPCTDHGLVKRLQIRAQLFKVKRHLEMVN